MMAVGNIQGQPQVANGREHLVGKEWVLLHRHPFFVRQGTGFEQNPIRNTLLPISCNSAPQRTCTSSASLNPKARPSFTAISANALRVPFSPLCRASRGRATSLLSWHRYARKSSELERCWLSKSVAISTAMAACPARVLRKSNHSVSGSRGGAMEDFQYTLDLPF